MKLVSVFAVLALCAGCNTASFPPAVNLNLYWHFVGAQGQVYGNGFNSNTGCPEANVDTVQIKLLDPLGYYSVQTFPCVQPNGAPGATYQGVNGTYTWTVTGWRGGLQGLPVYTFTDTENVVGDANGNATFDVGLLALYIDMNVTYQIGSATSPATCESVGVTQVSFELDQSGSPYYTNTGSNAFPVACGDPPQNNFFTVPSLPQGGYQFKYVAGLNSSLAPLYAVCSQAVIQAPATSGQTYSTATVLLAPATSTCPP